MIGPFPTQRGDLAVRMLVHVLVHFHLPSPCCFLVKASLPGAKLAFLFHSTSSKRRHHYSSVSAQSSLKKPRSFVHFFLPWALFRTWRPVPFVDDGFAVSGERFRVLSASLGFGELHSMVLRVRRMKSGSDLCFTGGVRSTGVGGSTPWSHSSVKTDRRRSRELYTPRGGPSVRFRPLQRQGRATNQAVWMLVRIKWQVLTFYGSK